jgi:hypothetical protein
VLSTRAQTGPYAEKPGALADTGFLRGQSIAARLAGPVVKGQQGASARLQARLADWCLSMPLRSEASIEPRAAIGLA